MAAAAMRFLLLACLVTATLPASMSRAGGPDPTIAAELITLVDAAREREGLVPDQIDARLMQRPRG